MGKRKGYLLLSLVLFFSVLVLTSTVGVLEQDSRLKRFAENEVKANLDCLRRAIDLYRRTENPSGNPADPLELALTGNDALAVIALLAQKSYLRGRIATGTLTWRIIENKVKNPSFEIDTGTTFPPVAGWQGNFTSGDGVPDGWQLTTDGAEQKISLGAGTYVASFWAKAASPTARVKLRVWEDPGPLRLELTGDHPAWKRHHGWFNLPAGQVVRLELLQSSGSPGDVALADGVMIEPWIPPAGAATATPVPSAWTKGTTVVSGLASYTIQQSLFEDLLNASGSIASLTWLFEW